MLGHFHGLQLGLLLGVGLAEIERGMGGGIGRHLKLRACRQQVGKVDREGRDQQTPGQDVNPQKRHAPLIAPPVAGEPANHHQYSMKCCAEIVTQTFSNSVTTWGMKTSDTW